MNIAVYCSSSNHISEDYLKEARKLGEWLAKNDHTLVFGGATGGSMSAVSEGAASVGGQITGVIPVAVMNMNRQSPLCTTMIEVKTMSERKDKMRELSDIFVALPGSFGTLDELFDVLTSGIVGEHKRPVIIVNQNGIYDDLLKLTARLKSEKFIPAEIFQPQITGNVDECIQWIESYKAKTQNFK